MFTNDAVFDFLNKLHYKEIIVVVQKKGFEILVELSVSNSKSNFILTKMPNTRVFFRINKRF